MDDCDPGFRETHLIILIILIHTTVTLVFSDDLACILDDDLVGFKAAIASNTISSISSLDDFNADSVLSASFASLLESCKSPVGAVFAASAAVCIITLVEHASVLAVLIATTFRRADTLRTEAIKQAGLLPQSSSFAHKSIF